MNRPTPKPAPTVAEAFFRQAFGCLSGFALRVAVVVVVVVVADWRSERKYSRRESERAKASETAAKLADELAKETDQDGRFVRKAEGILRETDVWGQPFRLAYRPGILNDRLEVRSAGPDGRWQSWDDVVVTQHSKITNKALAADAAAGVLDAAKQRLFGRKAEAEKK